MGTTRRSARGAARAGMPPASPIAFASWAPSPELAFGDDHNMFIEPLHSSSFKLKSVQFYRGDGLRAQRAYAGIDPADRGICADRPVAPAPADRVGVAFNRKRKRNSGQECANPGESAGSKSAEFAQQAPGDPDDSDRSLRPQRLRVHEVGGHRRGRRPRFHRAVPLLQVQAPLPVRDPCRGARGRAGAVEATSGEPGGLGQRCARACSTGYSISPSTRSSATGSWSPRRG